MNQLQTSLFDDDNDTTISEDIGAGIGREIAPVIQEAINEYGGLIKISAYFAIAASIATIYIGYVLYKESA